MIESRLNPEDGWLSVWWGDKDPAMPPAEVARAYREFIRNAGVVQAVVGSESPEIAAALLALPEFTILGREWRYARKWPSGVAASDRTGIRPATRQDATLISRILDESFGEAMGGVFPPERIERELFAAHFWNILVEEDGQPAGFGSAIHETEDGVVNFIAVVPPFRRRGIGGRIMDALLAELDRRPHEWIALTVEDHRAAAIRLYERYGFARSEGPWVNVRYMALPPAHLEQVAALEAAYLESDNPIVQSGFHGGPERWRKEREPILDLIAADGDLLDVGCANGHLLECLVRWGAERGRRIVPHGIDLGARLIEEARRRLPEFAANFEVANGWEWRPAHRYRYVYALWDCVPESHIGEFAGRLLERAVAPGGRLIMGAYGSRSRGESPLDIAAALRAAGHVVTGESAGGDPPLTRFAAVDRPRESSNPARCDPTEVGPDLVIGCAGRG